MTTDIHHIFGRRGVVLLGLAVLVFLGNRADAGSAPPQLRMGPIGGVILQPIEPLPSPPETTPIQPYGTHVPQKTSTTVDLAWRDDSEVEDGYRIERLVGGTWLAIAELPLIGAENVGSYTVRGLAQGTNHCFRVVPWNEFGAPNVPAVCATTTDVVGPITVMVTDLAGLVGELADRSALDYRPDVVTMAALHSIHAASAAPEFPVAAPSGCMSEALPVPPPRKIVYVDDTAQIRVSTGRTLFLEEGVHLMSGRGGLAQGALLYSDVATDRPHLLEIRGNNVRVSGLRFRGPSAGTDDDLPKKAAIYINDALDVIVDNNEFYNWTWAGVRVSHTPRATYSECRRINFTTAGRIRITENYFHHNQKQNSGYGVLIQRSSYAYIDKNTFDYNRHAIASTGGRDGYPVNELNEPLDPSRGPEQGYAAYLNLVLDGHAEQKTGFVITWQTHHFDVHGLENDWLGRDSYDGWAGETIDVAHNSFLCIKGTAFNVRGTPANAAYFRHNVAPEPVPLNEYALTGGCFYNWASVKESSDKDNVFVYGNVASADPRAEFGVGDFDGDGRDDVFLATGQGFYYSSAGVTEWRFLNRSTRRSGALTLTDHDGDGKTDVLTRVTGLWWISWSGTAPFVPLHPSTAISPGSFYSSDDVVGDFTGDGVTDRLRYDADRYFRTVDGASGDVLRSRRRM